MIKKLVYLATPYTHDDPKVMLQRFETVNKVACRLMNEGHIVFSPISHSHPIAEAGSLPVAWDYWKIVDTVYLSYCYKLFVLRADGWKSSIGVQAEIAIALDLGLEIEYIDN